MMFDCQGIMRWVLATGSFATDFLYVLAVAKSSSATIAAVATDQVLGCEDQHRNRWLGWLRFELCNRRKCRNQPSPLVAKPLLQPLQPGNYISAELSGII